MIGKKYMSHIHTPRVKDRRKVLLEDYDRLKTKPLRFGSLER